MGFLDSASGPVWTRGRYSWVPLYVKELGYLEEIKALEKEIAEVQKSPKAKAESWRRSRRHGPRWRPCGCKGWQAVLKGFQDGAIASLSPEHFAYVITAPGVSAISK